MVSGLIKTCISFVSKATEELFCIKDGWDQELFHKVHALTCSITVHVGVLCECACKVLK